MSGDLSQFSQDRPLTLIGCGRMGGALLSRWRAAGLADDAVCIVRPGGPVDGLAWYAAAAELPSPVRGTVLLAVKPQKLSAVAPALRDRLGPDTPVISILAGTPLARLDQALGPRPIVRAMPNTPAAVGAGMTALIGPDAGGAMAAAEALFGAVGHHVRLTDEAQMDAVTALSGSGPAYVFHMVEALVAAAQAEGVPRDQAALLARQTVIGAGALMAADPRPADALRAEVTSPGGTTQAGLAPLMGEDGLTQLMTKALTAAAARSRALGQETDE